MRWLSVVLRVPELPAVSGFVENEVSWLGVASLRSEGKHRDHDRAAEVQAVQQSLVARRASNCVHQRTVHEDLKYKPVVPKDFT